MFLAIEIGGTKLQLGVGRGDGSPLLALERFDVDPAQGASGILRRIEPVAAGLIARHGVQAVGIGFGGPIDTARGQTIKSHQIEGWQDFPLVAWGREAWQRPVVVGNDADLAGLAEARFGAGRGHDPVFYVTVGTGIGGGLIVGGELYRGSGWGAAEIGHLRPGLHADRADDTVESLASGWGIAAAALARLGGAVAHPLKPYLGEYRARGPEALRQHLLATEEAEQEYAADLRERCGGDIDRLTAKIIGQAAADGNALALNVLHDAAQALGWGLAQMVTLVAPSAIVVGGGVSLLGEALWLAPLRVAVEQYVFPPFIGKYHVLAAELGEEMVVHGALALAASAARR